MSKIQLVIFDCDGVLLDSEIVAAAGELEVYSEYGVNLEPNEKVVNEARLIKGADTVLDMLDQARCVCSNAPLSQSLI